MVMLDFKHSMYLRFNRTLEYHVTCYRLESRAIFLLGRCFVVRAAIISVLAIIRPHVLGWLPLLVLCIIFVLVGKTANALGASRYSELPTACILGKIWTFVLVVLDIVSIFSYKKKI